MARYAYERLSAESGSLLLHETSRSFAHSATLLLFDAGPLAQNNGGVDIDSIRRGITSRLHRAPRFRQKLKWIPIEDHPVWVDDHDFNLDFHLRHTSLPRPGGMDQLLKMAARIMAQRIDRHRPLWECWVLEGLSEGRFALLLKTHNCLIDPVSGGDLFQALLSSDAADAEPAPPPYRPRPVPSSLELGLDEVVRQARLPRQALERLRSFTKESHGLRHDIEARVRAIARMLGYTMRPALETPLNGHVGPHRRFDLLVTPLEQARAIHKALGGTVHDVILATAAGAVRGFMNDRLVNPATLDFRIATAVSRSTDDARDDVGQWIVDLPIWEADAATRVAEIAEQTRALRENDTALGARTLWSVAEWSSSRLLALGARAISGRIPVNMTLVNIPGPQVPLFFLGARLLQSYGHAPLHDNTALGITVFSYDGQLCWGLNADFDLVPDLDRFTAALAAAFGELVQLSKDKPRHLEVVG